MIRNLLPNSQRADNIHCIKMIPKDRKKGKKKKNSPTYSGSISLVYS